MNEIKLNIEEEKIKDIIKRRKRLEKTKLFFRRIITFAINVVFLLLGWGSIVAVNLYNTEITTFFNNYKWLRKVA